MYTRHYAPWEHYPKLLSFHEIQNPMQVIIDFFNLDNPEGHIEALKEWRECVTSENVFNHDHRGPAAVVHYYETNIKLLEAAYLLLMANESRIIPFDSISAEQLSDEKIRWQFYPLVLSIKEQSDPYIAIDAVFETLSLQLYRDLLFEWLFTALSTRSGDEDLTAAEVIAIYENLIKLYEATWLIYQRQEGKRYYKHKRH
jgi:hypothetical protein